MNFLIENAWAAGSGVEGGALMQLLPLVVLLVLFYFLLIRPQMKRSKDHRQMISNLSKGDEVVTNGGLIGRVIEIGDNFMTLEIADSVQIKVQRQSVSSVLPKGTMKSL